MWMCICTERIEREQHQAIEQKTGFFVSTVESKEISRKAGANEGEAWCVVVMGVRLLSVAGSLVHREDFGAGGSSGWRGLA